MPTPIVTKTAPGQTARQGMWPFGTAQKITQQIAKTISSAAPSSRTVSIALMLGEPERAACRCWRRASLSTAGRKMLAAMKQQDDAEHREGEALLLDPAAALDVVDPAEGGVHRAPEGGADPERAEEGGDPDRGRVVLDPVEDVGQLGLLGVGEEPLQVVEHARLDPLDLQHLAEDEEDEQGEREDRQHQVVGDHRREPGDVLLVGAVPEGAQPWAGMSQWNLALTSESEALECEQAFEWPATAPTGPRSADYFASRTCSPVRFSRLIGPQGPYHCSD